MALTTFDPGFIAAAKQFVSFSRLASRTAVAAAWSSVFDLAGNPGAGVLAGTSTAAGVVPTDATAGTPVINAFGAGATGYLAQVDFGNTVACRMKLFDMLFKAGAYAFTAATTTLAAQPSYSSRVPAGTDFAETQIWIEVSTAFAAGTAWQVQVLHQSIRRGSAQHRYPARAGGCGPHPGAHVPARPAVGRRRRAKNRKRHRHQRRHRHEV